MRYQTDYPLAEPFQVVAAKAVASVQWAEETNDRNSTWLQELRRTAGKESTFTGGMYGSLRNVVNRDYRTATIRLSLTDEQGRPVNLGQARLGTKRRRECNGSTIVTSPPNPTPEA